MSWKDLQEFYSWTRNCHVGEDEYQRGILTGTAILKAVSLGLIAIDPLNRENVNPASIDLTLGEEIKVYRDNIKCDELKEENEDGRGILPRDDGSDWVDPLDAKKDNPTVSFKKKLNDRFLLRPGVGYLMHTAESISTGYFNPVLDGKSSIGRLFISVHETAGYGDVGFSGQYTLEVSVIHPVWVYIGQKIAQMRFHSLLGPREQYKGNYMGATAHGAISSKSWKQFT
jgi:dCTP deaminase